MKLFLNECKKLFDPILLALLAVFALLFQYGFFGINGWPQYYTGNPWETANHADMVARFGPTLGRGELPAFRGFYGEQVAAFEAELAKSELFAANGITTYQQFTELGTGQQGELSPAEQALHEEELRFTFDLEPASELRFRLQDTEAILRSIDNGWTFATDETIQNIQDALAGYAPEMRAAQEEKCRSDELSLLPTTPIEVVGHDTIYLCLIAYISIFAVALFMLVTDRLRGIYPLALSTRTGRRLYRIQAAACGSAGLLIGTALCAVYGAALLQKGAAVFFACPYSNLYTDVWPKLTYGQFLLVTAGEVILTSGIAGCLAYLVGRLAGSYIAAVAAAIPTLALFAWVVYLGGHDLFRMREYLVQGLFSDHFWRAVYLPIAGAALLSAAALAAVACKVRRDEKGDVL